MGGQEMKWLKGGCLGCLGIVGLAAVVLAVLILLPLTQGPREPEPVHRELTHELPPPPPPPDLPSLPGVELPPSPPTSGAVRLALDLSVGSFRIEPGPEGQPLKVEASYDASAFELSEDYDEGSKTYRVEFRARGGWLGLFGRRVDDSDAEVRIFIPRGQPVALTGAIGVGQSRVELGGLWLTEVDLKLGTGEHRLAVSEPLATPLPEFRIDASIGELEIRDLGNASPGRVVIQHGVGEVLVDLAGAWRGDAEIDLDVGVGECRVRLPDQVRVTVERSSVGLGEVQMRGLDRRSPPPGAPELTLRLHGGIGEVRIDS